MKWWSPEVKIGSTVKVDSKIKCIKHTCQISKQQALVTR